MTKINMTELLADREECSRLSNDPPFRESARVSAWERRRKRTPNLEAAYIKAVEALQQCREFLISELGFDNDDWPLSVVHETLEAIHEN